MRYYKITNNGEFIGAVTEENFICFQEKHNILIACRIDDAQFALCGDSIYRSPWMKPLENSGSIPHTVADVVEITEEEYNILYEAMKSGEEPEYDPADFEPTEYVEEETNAAEDNTLEYVQAKKVDAMSKQCEATIVSGFDIVLSDGEEYHFSLDTQDQLNLITLSAMVANGDTAIPYHADGELCKFYSPEDITSIVNGATAHKTYHVSYYNSLKNYINSMDNMVSVGAVEYGVEIPVQYQSDVLKSLIQQA